MVPPLPACVLVSSGGYAEIDNRVSWPVLFGVFTIESCISKLSSSADCSSSFNLFNNNVDVSLLELLMLWSGRFLFGSTISWREVILQKESTYYHPWYNCTELSFLFHSYPTWAYIFTIWNIFTSGNLKHEQKSKIITAPYEIMVTWPQPCHVTRRRLRAKPRQVSSVPLLSLLGTHGLYLRCFVVSVIRQNCVVCFDQFWFDFLVFLCVDRECLTGRLSPSCQTLMTPQTCWIAWETQVTIVNLGFDLRRKMPLRQSRVVGVAVDSLRKGFSIFWTS